ncbi:hypothetical protein N665_3864s0004 [Sinapis alba]|nr:hypothetical protein N665_3864s0004 [Sinapis alba]
MMMKSALPFDLEEKILACVPKKSRAQWQTTCKRWYTLLQDLLAKKHLAQAGREFILLLNDSVYSTVINLQGVHNNADQMMEFGGKLESLKDSNDLKIHDIFCCNGLILCTMVGRKMLVVCNPSNGETRYVEPRTCYRTSDSYALGYEGSKSSCINNYKILRYCRYYNSQLTCMVSELELYEFKSDSWRVLNVDNNDWESQYLDISARGVSVKGNTYWVAKKDDDHFFQLILSFDFTTERLGLLPLPYESDGPDDIMTDEHDDTAVLSVVRDEQLSVLHQYLHRCSLEMKIWMSNKIETGEVSWGEFLVVNLGDFMFGKVVNIVSFVLDEENKRAVCCRIGKNDRKEECASISIIGENIHRDVYGQKIRYGLWPHLLNYVPSPVHILKKSTPKGKRKRKTRRLVKYIKLSFFLRFSLF